MLDWLKPPKQANALLALRPEAGGIAMASVSRDANLEPVLDWVEYLVATTHDAGRKSQIAQVLRSHDVQQARASGLMPMGAYNLILVEAPDVPQAEIRAAVRWRVKDLIDFSIDDAVIDVFEVPPLKGGRANMLYAVVARPFAPLSTNWKAPN